MRNDHSSTLHRIQFMLLLNKLMSWKCYILVQSIFLHSFLYHCVQFDDFHQQNSMFNINENSQWVPEYQGIYTTVSVST